jgi:hypothetical protein
MTPQARRQASLAAALVATLLARDSWALARIGIAVNSGLGFGQVVATGVAGTVTVTPAGARMAAGGVVLGNGLSASAATFTVTGEPDTSYSITLPDSALLSNGSAEMAADSFLSVPSGSGTLGPGGTQGVAVGATLHVGAAQAATRYSGTYSLTVAYE